MRHGYPLSLLLFNIDLEFLARAIRQDEETKGIQICKEVGKLPLFLEDMILHLKSLKNSMQKLLDTLSRFSNVAEYKIY
jgi:hypothetical protein